MSMMDYISSELLEEWDDIFEHRKAANYQDPYWEHQEEIMQTKIHYELYKALAGKHKMSFEMWCKHEAKAHRNNMTDSMRKKSWKETIIPVRFVANICQMVKVFM